MEPTTKTQSVAGSGASAARPAQPWLYGGLLAVVVAVAGAVRFRGLFNDLWLDEIWSLRLVEPLKSPGEILTRVFHDNNHPLNSLFLYLLMPVKADWTLRLLSWFAGTATVGLAGLIAHRQFQLLHPGDAPGRARTAGLITAVIFGGSYLLIHYSSEARGYAPAVGFSFLALFALWRGSGRPAGAWAVVYGLACVLALLAHLVAIQVMLAGLAWSAVKALQTWKSWRDRLVHLACWHLVPWAFFGFYYLAFLRRVKIGGGPDNTLASVLGDLAAYSLGIPAGLGMVVALPVFLAVSLTGLVLVWRRDRAAAAFYGTAVFVAPVLGLAFSRFALLFPRYFLGSAACALLLAGYGLTRLWYSRRAAPVACLAVLAAFLFGGGTHTLRLLRYGRGQYRQALRHVAERTPTAAITVSGDSDLRNFMIVEYYASAVGPGREFQYYPGEQMPALGPQWLILPRVRGETLPPEGLFEVSGLRYQLETIYPYAALSGLDWYLYRNLDPVVLVPVSR